MQPTPFGGGAAHAWKGHLHQLGVHVGCVWQSRSRARAPAGQAPSSLFEVSRQEAQYRVRRNRNLSLLQASKCTQTSERTETYLSSCGSCLQATVFRLLLAEGFLW